MRTKGNSGWILALLLPSFYSMRLHLVATELNEQETKFEELLKSRNLYIYVYNLLKFSWLEILLELFRSMNRYGFL